MEILTQSLRETFVSLGVVWGVFANFWFIILPATFYYLFMHLWMQHINTKYWLTLDWIMLEIIPPKDIEKSPKPMESLFAGMAGAEKTFTPIETYIQGAFPDSFSLELVSDAGDVHFYIRTLKKYRNLVEAHLYAQYPNIEITEVPDYVEDVPKVTPNTMWDLWGSDFELVRPDVYPIKTYKFFEEDITGKMIDPLAGLIETMAKLPPGQKIWLQYIISPASPGFAMKEGAKIINKLKGIEEAPEGILANIWADVKDILGNLYPGLNGEIAFAKKEKKELQPLEFRLTPGEKETLKALEDNMGKIVFTTKMRMLYVGRKENMDKTFVSAFIGGIKQFGDDNLNSFKPEADSKTFANFIFIKPRLRFRQRKIINRYRNRSMMGSKFILSTSELATIFHIPDMQVAAPNLIRVEAKTGGAPVNLPID